MNSKWDEDWGGELLLASLSENSWKAEVSVKPLFNTTVLFSTSANSLHGHPKPLMLPEGVSRDSIALYYYVANCPDDHSGVKCTTTGYVDQ